MNYHDLTPRQRQILELVAAGKTNREISVSLHITENTVEYHLVKRVFPLLGVRNRAAAAEVYHRLQSNALRESVVASTSPLDRLVGMAYQIKSIQNRDELNRVYAFAQQMGLANAKHTLEFYVGHLARTPQLLIYAECENEICGCALGSVENDHVLVGPVEVAPARQRQGIGRAMLQQLDHAALALGQHTLILGAAEEAEGFYLRCGYQPFLFVQYPEPAFLPQLRALNRTYEIAWESQADGWSKIMLRTPQVDLALQRAYESQFPNCSTQTVCIKNL